MKNINIGSCRNNKTNMFTTLFLGVLDLPTGHLRYCNAGHEIPFVIDDGKMTPLPTVANLPVGAFEDSEYQLQETKLNPESTLFMYTDGVTEAKNALREQFGMQRVEDVLKKCAQDNMLPQQILETFNEKVHQFVSGYRQSDDITMLAIRYEAQSFDSKLTETLTLKNNVKEVARLSAFIKQVTEQLQIDKELASQLRLAVEEAVVNVIDYAYPAEKEGEIEVRVMSDGNIIKFVIIDSGGAFDPTAREKADITLSAEDRQIGGLGLLLVRELMDSINYEREGGKNILTLMKKVKVKV
jgi:sigma-B regulation protein RsbU (phosphoserine phosphatase)